MATGVSSKWKNDPHSRNNHDEELLEEPYAQAVLEMEYKPEVVLQAVKTLQKRHRALTAETLLREILETEKSKAGRSPREGLKRPARDHYGSDGESEEGSLEDDTASPSSPPESDDLQVDAEAEAVSTFIADRVGDEEPVAPPAKKASRAKDGRETENLLQKLYALREENRRLKTRQLCRKCRAKPVAITFLPCGHFSFCYQCGQNFQVCPLCRKTILADVKTFLA